MTQRVEKQHWQDTANDLMLHNAQVVHERELMHGGVLVQHGRIASVFSEQDKPAAVPGADIIDLGYRYLAPGMLDIHIHGGAGNRCSSPPQDRPGKTLPESFFKMSHKLRPDVSSC